MPLTFLNTFYSTISFFLKSLSGLILPLLVSKILGTDIFSDFSFYLIVGSAFLILCEYGSIFWMPNHAQQAPSDLRTQFYSDNFCEALNVRVFCTVVTTLILAVFVVLAKLSFTNFMLILALVLYCFFSLFYYHFRSLGLFKSEFALSLKIELTSFLLPVTCLLMSRNYDLFVLMFFGVRCGLIFLLFHRYKIIPRLSISAAIKTSSDRFPYLSQVAVSFAVLYVDTFFVKYFYPSELYLHQGFLRLSLLFCLLIPVLNSIFLYYMRSSYVVSVERYLNFFKQLALVTLLITLALSTLSYIAFPFFVDFFLGNQYSDLNRHSFQFSSLIFMKYLSTIFGLHLTVVGLQAVRAKLLFSVFVVGSLGLYFFLSELCFHYVFSLMVLLNLLILTSYLVYFLKFDFGVAVGRDV